MTGRSSLVIQQDSTFGTLGPRGLSTKQQQAIAIAQGHTAFQSQQQQHQQQQQRRRRRSSNHHLNDSQTACCIYVCELDSSVDETTLRNIFCPLVSVNNIHLCRDAITNKSLRYAYIDFNSETEGSRAIQQLDQTLINGKPCRIMWARKDHQKVKQTISSGNLFIKNLNPMVTTKSLLDTFSVYGHITSCKIVMDEQGRSKGYGFIHYDTVESAERAINKVNGMTLYDREIFVGHHIPKQERIQRIEQAKQQFTNVYVKNLGIYITEQELRELFDGYGPIASVLIQKDDQGVSRGFGFVNFERHQDAEKAVSQMHNTEYVGKRLFVSRAQKRLEREEELRKNYDHLGYENYNKYYHGVNLYVKNLPDTVDDYVLREIFTSFGSIISTKVMRDEKSLLSRGFGFVCFTTPDEANRAVMEMNGKSIHNKTLYVALAQKKEDRKLQSEHHRVIQQPFVPTLPINGYMNGNGNPIYYDPYPSYPSSQINGMIPPRPIRWNQPPPPLIIKQSYPPVTLSYSGYRPPPSPMYDTTPFTTSSTLIPPSSSSSSVDILEPVDLNDKKDHEMTLENDPIDTQKQLLGEHIYKVVNARYPEASGKVTGMLLEMELDDLIELVKNKSLLEELAQEAMAVLEQHRDDTHDVDR